MAQTYKFGNGTWARKKGSTLAYNDEDNNFKPLPFSFERNSIATRVNKEGLIEVVGNDIPRIDYADSAEGALLLENSSTNLIPYSEDFSNAAWTKSGSSVVSGFVSPSGDTSAFKLVESSTTSTHELEVIGIAVVADKYTISLFAKADERGKIRIQLRNYFAGNPSVIFDLENGTFEQNVQAIGSMTLLSNGFYKCTFTTVLNAIAGGNAILNVNLVDEANQISYTGNGTSGLYIYGAQLEQGSVASSYIPTNGSTVQRSAETCSDSGNSEVFNDSQGVLFANIAALTDDANTLRWINLSNGSTSNRVAFYYRTDVNQLTYLVSSGSTQVFSTVTLSSASSFNKIAAKYKQNNFSLWISGFEVITDPSGNAPIGLNQLSFDNAVGGDNFYGKTKEIAYYDTALTDEELEYMTSYRSLNEMVTELNLNAL